MCLQSEPYADVCYFSSDFQFSRTIYAELITHCCGCVECFSISCFKKSHPRPPSVIRGHVPDREMYPRRILQQIAAEEPFC